MVSKRRQAPGKGKKDTCGLLPFAFVAAAPVSMGIEGGDDEVQADNDKRRDARICDHPPPSPPSLRPRFVHQRSSMSTGVGEEGRDGDSI